MNKRSQGFTLIELLVIMAMVSILSVMALKGYKETIYLSDEASAQAEILRISHELSKYRLKHLTYTGYETTSVTLPKPENGVAVAKPTKYTITVVDLAAGNGKLNAANAKGGGWSIKAESKTDSNYTLVLNSNGIQCKSKNKQNVTYNGCKGNDAEGW